MLEDVVDDYLHQLVLVDQASLDGQPRGRGLKLPVGLLYADAEGRGLRYHERLALEELCQAGLAGALWPQYGHGTHVQGGLATDRSLAVRLGGYRADNDALHWGGGGRGGRAWKWMVGRRLWSGREREKKKVLVMCIIMLRTDLQQTNMAADKELFTYFCNAVELSSVSYLNQAD